MRRLRRWTAELNRSPDWISPLAKLAARHAAFMATFTVAWGLAFCGGTGGVVRAEDESAKFTDNFETGKLDAWEFADPKVWRIEQEEGGNHVLSQFKHSPVKTPVRSPFNRALVKDLIVSEFILDVDLQSTVADYGHRDLCLFFGYQDPAHMYYVHLGKKTDDFANQIFIVNNADRKKISTKTTEGTPWDEKWHHVRIAREVQTGSIEVFFDDQVTPAMQARDMTFTWGQVGIGSFDDTGRFDNVRLTGKKAEKPAATP